MARLSVALVLCFVVLPTAHTNEHMVQEIDHLLKTVATSDCVFIRNGKEHSGQAAKDHLNLKRRRGKSLFSGAEEFIDTLASRSSWSGKPYFVRCGEEEAEPASIWFKALLDKYRAAWSD